MPKGLAPPRNRTVSRTRAILELFNAVRLIIFEYVLCTWGFSFATGNSFTHANAGFAHVLSGLLSIVVPANTAIGITCHPLSVVGIGGGNQW